MLTAPFQPFGDVDKLNVSLARVDAVAELHTDITGTALDRLRCAKMFACPDSCFPVRTVEEVGNVDREILAFREPYPAGVLRPASVSAVTAHVFKNAPTNPVQSDTVQSRISGDEIHVPDLDEQIVHRGVWNRSRRVWLAPYENRRIIARSRTARSGGTDRGIACLVIGNSNAPQRLV